MSLLQTVDEIVAVTLEEMGLPANETFKLTSFALDFVRAMQKDVKTLIPERDKEQFYKWDTYGHHIVPLPNDYYDYVSVGTQVGRYIKGIAVNNRLTVRKSQPNPFPMIDAATQNIWYWGYGWGWGIGMGAGGGIIEAYGNGGDYGDVMIDMENKVLITSPTFRYKNLVLRYYPVCLTPSSETVIHPWFISALKYWLNYKYWFFRGDNRWQVAKMEYEKEYLFAVQSKYRMKIPTIVKIFERIRGYHNG